MRIMVTGGFGFIGSHFVRSLNPKLNDIVILDKLTYAGNQKNLIDLNLKDFQHEKIDIADNSALLKFFENNKKFDLIVHFAAESHVDRSIDNSRVFIETNIIGTFNLLEVLRAKKIARMIHVSTDEVYGSIIDGSWSEDSPIDPKSPYSASKASSDVLCLSYINTYGLDITVTRCANNFGPYQSVEKFIPNTIIKVLANQSVPIYGNGANLREWIHVSDHVNALHQIINSEKRNSSVYNIGGESKDNLSLAKEIIKLMGADDKLIKFVKDRKGHDFRYSVNSSLIRSELGWIPQKNFEIELTNTIDWYMNNSNWVKQSMLQIRS